MAFAQTEPLRTELETALPERPFGLRFWDGSSVPATVEAAPSFSFLSPQAFAHLIRAPGELGIGRAYVAGLVEVDDLDAAVRMVDEWQPPSVPFRSRARIGLALLRACGLVVPPRAPSAELRLRGRRHSLLRDRRAVRHHYDVGNDFFGLFLDKSMTYSCAVFSRGARTLEEAQGKSMDLVFDIVNKESRRPVENPVKKVFREGKVVGLAPASVSALPRDQLLDASRWRLAPCPDDPQDLHGAVFRRAWLGLL